MGQTILDEYLAKWKETCIAPELTEFGFDGGIYGLLVECQDVMLKLGTAANDARARADAIYRELNTSRGRIAQLESNLRHAMTHEATMYTYTYIQARDARIAELESQLKWQEDAHQLALRKAGAEMESLQEKNADLEAIAAEREKIATIAVQRYREITNAA